MDKIILYLNQDLAYKIISQADYNSFDCDILSSRAKFDYGMSAWYSRHGENFLPFDNKISKLSEFAMPDYDPNFSLDFTDVTDKRCHQLKEKYFDKEWYVQWSGGIDSTLIICALLKNLNKADLDNVTVLCNHGSIAENPDFFIQYIKPNFKILDSTFVYSPGNENDVYIVDGELGDQLFGHRCTTILSKNNLLTLNWRTQSGKLIKILTDLSDKPFAEWLYKGMKRNIESCSVPIETYQDWAWWLGFNLTWIPVIMRDYEPYFTKHQTGFNTFLNHNFQWFNSVDYQQWSMNANSIPEHKFNKSSSKNYIKSIWNNDYFQKYKTKTDSISRNRYSMKEQSLGCLLDDFSTLRYPADSLQIQNLIKNHIQN